MEKLSHAELVDAREYLKASGYHFGTQKDIRHAAIAARIVSATQNFGGSDIPVSEQATIAAGIKRFFRIPEKEIIHGF